MAECNTLSRCLARPSCIINTANIRYLFAVDQVMPPLSKACVFNFAVIENITTQYGLKVSMGCVATEFISSAFNLLIIGKYSQ